MTNQPPSVYVNRSYDPVQVSWQRLGPLGEETGEWHIVVIRRYKKDGRARIPNEFYYVKTADIAVEVASKESPPRLLTEGSWSKPIVCFT